MCYRGLAYYVSLLDCNYSILTVFDKNPIFLLKNSKNLLTSNNNCAKLVQCLTKSSASLRLDSSKGRTRKGS